MKKHLIIFFFILAYNAVTAQKNSCTATDLIERLEYTKAIELLTQCIDVTSKNTEGMLQLANCYYYTSKTEEAEKAQNPQYYFKFGMYLSGRFRPLVDCHLLLALCKL